MTRRPTLPQSPGPGSKNGGWTQPLDDLWTQLVAEAHGLAARLRSRGMPGVPAAYAATKVFRPASSTVPVPVPDVSSAVTYYNAKPVLLDGATYDIPVIFPGAGVFVARRVDITIFQQNGTGREIARTLSTTLAPLMSLASPELEDSGLVTFRYSQLGLWPDLTDSDLDSPACNFFWNMYDARTKRYLADELISSAALMPMTVVDPYPAAYCVAQQPIDGGAFEFSAPWVFERDGQCIVQVRPITPIFQAADATSEQSVTIQVELHGERYETLQDAMRQGALTRPVRPDRF